MTRQYGGGMERRSRSAVTYQLPQYCHCREVRGRSLAWSTNLFEGNPFFDQHHRNVITDGVEDLLVGANQTAIKLF